MFILNQAMVRDSLLFVVCDYFSNGHRTVVLELYEYEACELGLVCYIPSLVFTSNNDNDKRNDVYFSQHTRTISGHYRPSNDYLR